MTSQGLTVKDSPCGKGFSPGTSGRYCFWKLVSVQGFQTLSAKSSSQRCPRKFRQVKPFWKSVSSCIFHSNLAIMPWRCHADQDDNGAREREPRPPLQSQRHCLEFTQTGPVRINVPEIYFLVRTSASSCISWVHWNGFPIYLFQNSSPVSCIEHSSKWERCVWRFSLAFCFINFVVCVLRKECP